MTKKRALVLAGGGRAGIAWETGILRGIADESAETAEALRLTAIVTSALTAAICAMGSGSRMPPSAGIS